jgi:hypothetical protein
MTSGTGAFEASDAGNAGTRLPALGWLFVSMALVEAWLVLQNTHLQFGFVPGLTVTGDTGAPFALVYGLGNVASVLLPAAMLYREPSATRTHPMLLIGAGLVSAWTLAVAMFSWWAGQVTNPDDVVFASSFGPIAAVVRIAGLVLMALGLARLRSRRWSPRAIVVTIVAIGIGLLPTTLIYLVLVGMAGTGANIGLLDLAPAGVDLAGEAAIGAWLGVAVGAWLDGEQPGRFWGPLAIISVALLAVDVLQTIQLLTTGSLVDGYGTQLWVGSASALVRLAVFALALPLKRAD